MKWDYTFNFDILGPLTKKVTLPARKKMVMKKGLIPKIGIDLFLDIQQWTLLLAYNPCFFRLNSGNLGYFFVLNFTFCMLFYILTIVNSDPLYKRASCITWKTYKVYVVKFNKEATKSPHSGEISTFFSFDDICGHTSLSLTGLNWGCTIYPGLRWP